MLSLRSLHGGRAQHLTRPLITIFTPTWLSLPRLRHYHPHLTFRRNAGNEEFPDDDDIDGDDIFHLGASSTTATTTTAGKDFPIVGFSSSSSTTVDEQNFGGKRKYDGRDGRSGKDNGRQSSWSGRSKNVRVVMMDENQPVDVCNALVRDYAIRMHYRSAWNEIFAQLMYGRDLIAAEKLLRSLQRTSTSAWKLRREKSLPATSVMWYTYLIATAGRSGNLMVALEKFEFLERHEDVRMRPIESTYMALLNACTACKDYEKFDELLMSIPSGGISQTQTAVCRLRRYLAQADYDSAVHVLQEVQQQHLKLPEMSVISIIRQLDSCSMPQGGIRFMTQLCSLYKDRNNAGNMRWKFDSTASEEQMDLLAHLLYGVTLFDTRILVDEVRTLIGQGLPLNSRMCGMIFRALDMNHDISLVKTFWDEFDHLEVHLDETSYQHLLKSASRASDVDFAKRIWRDYLKSVDAGSSNLTLYACSQAVAACALTHNVRFMKEVLTDMDQYGIAQRDTKFYSKVITVVSSHASNVPRVVSVLEQIKNDPQMVLDWQFFTVMFDVFYKMHRLHGQQVLDVLHVLVEMLDSFFAKNPPINVSDMDDTLRTPYSFEDSQNRTLLSSEHIETSVMPLVQNSMRKTPLYQQLDMNAIVKHIALNVLRFAEGAEDPQQVKCLSMMTSLLQDMLILSKGLTVLTDGTLISSLAAFKTMGQTESYDLLLSEYTDMFHRINQVESEKDDRHSDLLVKSRALLNTVLHTSRDLLSKLSHTFDPPTQRKRH